MQAHILIEHAIAEHRDALEQVQHKLQIPIAKACEMVADTIKNGGKVLLAGNGGSAADAQHIAAEFTGRFVRERKPLAAVALTTDTSALTAIANDYGYDQVFSRQLQALARPGDLFIAISTSGNSPGILAAVEAAKKTSVQTIAFSGRDGGALAKACDLPLVIPHDVTARIQEMHILIGHIICEYLDHHYS